eukprot:scaffold462_cov195-Pinguiococcus_pyrenoidosus.AAC.77
MDASEAFERPARVLYAFEGDAEASKLQLRPGELVFVLDPVPGQWWWARGADGTEGYLPNNYIEMLGRLPGEPSSLDMERLSLKKHGGLHQRSKTVGPRTLLGPSWGGKSTGVAGSNGASWLFWGGRGRGTASRGKEKWEEMGWTVLDSTPIRPQKRRDGMTDPSGKHYVVCQHHADQPLRAAAYRDRSTST